MVDYEFDPGMRPEYSVEFGSAVFFGTNLWVFIHSRLIQEDGLQQKGKQDYAGRFERSCLKATTEKRSNWGNLHQIHC